MNYKRNRTTDIIFVSLIIILAIVFRLFLMRYRFAVVFDEVNYLKLAASGNLEGLSNVFHTYWSPFYPLVVALFSKLVPNFELAGRLVSIVCGSLIIMPVYLFTRKYISRYVAILSAVLIAFLPTFAFLSTRAQTEALYTLLGVTSVFIGWRVLNEFSVKDVILIGILFGLAYLTKPEGIGFFIVFSGILVFLMIVNLVKKHFSMKLVIIGLSVAVICLIVAFSYLNFLHKATGKWTISAKGKANQQFEAVSTGLTGKTFDVFRSLSKDNKHVLIDQIYHIGTFLNEEVKESQPSVPLNYNIVTRKYAENFYKVVAFGMNHALTSPILILIVLGLFSSVWDKKRLYRDLYLLSYIVFFWFIVIPLFHINDRYFISVFPIAIIWASQGIIYLGSWFKKTIAQNVNGNYGEKKLLFWATAIVVAILLVTLFFPQLGKIINRDRWSAEFYHDPVEQKIAGEWIKEHFDNTPIIMSRGHTVDFYAGNFKIAESVTIPKNDINRILEYAKYREVDFLVLNERYLASYPHLSNLLYEENIPESLELVYKNDQKPGLKTVVYKIDQTEEQTE